MMWLIILDYHEITGKTETTLELLYTCVHYYKQNDLVHDFTLVHLHTCMYPLGCMIICMGITSVLYIHAAIKRLCISVSRD